MRLNEGRPTRWVTTVLLGLTLGGGCAAELGNDGASGDPRAKQLEESPRRYAYGLSPESCRLGGEADDVTSRFDDIEGHWAAQAIDELARLGIVKGMARADGTPTGRFEPNRDVSRAELAAILYQAADLDTVAETGRITPVTRDHVLYQKLDRDGNPAGLLSDDEIRQAARCEGDAAEYFRWKFQAEGVMTSEWWYTPVCAVTALHFLEGDATSRPASVSPNTPFTTAIDAPTRFRPQDPITVAEVQAAVVRFAGMELEEDGGVDAPLASRHFVDPSSLYRRNAFTSTRENWEWYVDTVYTLLANHALVLPGAEVSGRDAYVHEHMQKVCSPNLREPARRGFVAAQLYMALATRGLGPDPARMCMRSSTASDASVASSVYGHSRWLGDARAARDCMITTR